MADVIHFPGTTRALGESYEARTIRAGIAEAERRGIPRDRIEAATATDCDRQFATYFLGLLGSHDEQDQHQGAYGLARLLAATGDAA